MPGQLGPRTTIGRLRHRVRIESPSPAADEFGQRVPTWAEVAAVRAEVLALTGREVFMSGGVQANCTHHVKLRWRAGLTPKHRLVWLDTGLVLNVVACPQSVGTSNLVECWCLAEQ